MGKVNGPCTVHLFFYLKLKTETWENGTIFIFFLNRKNKKLPWFSIFTFRGRKWINSLNVRFPCVGGNETPLSTDWSSNDQMVPSSFSFVQQNKSPPLLKRLLQLLRSSPSHQTTRLTNGLTQTTLGQRLDRAYFCVGIDSIWQILGAYCRNMYVPRICSPITLLVYFFGAPHIFI